MIFKEGTYIITDKNHDSATCVLLSEDFNPHTDSHIPYINWFDVYYKPRTKNVVTHVFANHEDNNGGTISFDLSDNWHYAPNNVISIASGIVDAIKNGIAIRDDRVIINLEI